MNIYDFIVYNTHTPVLTAGYFFVCLIINLIVFFVVCFSEIEALEACKWLRAAGFPQYAQMYEGEQHFNYKYIQAVAFLIKF